jgi:hypothetical protein
LRQQNSHVRGDGHERPWLRRRGLYVQVAVYTEHHLIVAHEVTNSGSDPAQVITFGLQRAAGL